MPDRHTEKPLSLRLGAERQPVEDAAVRAGVPVRQWILSAVREKLACHCLCGVLHPDETGVCDMRAVTTRRFESPATGPRDVPICAPCATAQGVPLLTGDGRG